MKKINGWAIGSVIIVLVLALPNLNILIHLFDPGTKVWEHVKEYLLKDYIINSIILVLGTVSLASIIASLLAWFVSFYDFPGQSFFKLALIMPIAIPPYIAAYTYSAIFSYTGFIQVFLREDLGIKVSPGFFNIMNMQGAIIIFALYLYPYIYLILQSFFEKTAAGPIEAARVLGASSQKIFFRIVLPLARYAIVAGATLVSFEVLSDYGVVDYFGIQVFTSAIFKTWTGFNDVASALKLSAILLVTVILLSSVESYFSKRKNYQLSVRFSLLRPSKAKGASRFLIPLFVHFIFFISLVLPIGQMLYWAYQSFENIRLNHFFEALLNSFSLGLLSSFLILVLSLIIANYRRLYANYCSATCSKLALIGYSIPGTVIAITVLLFFIDINKIFGLNFLNTLTMLVFAYLMRYLAVSYQAISSGMNKLGLRYTEAARTLGKSSWQSFLQLDLAMLRPAMIAGFILTFVDIVKELPLVLILRPFNYSSLSTSVFQYAHDEMIPESSLASLAIILLSALPLIFFYYYQKRENDQ